MSEKQQLQDDGGPAFPFKCQGPTTAPEIYYGMTLRDHFAGLAMQGHLAAMIRADGTAVEDVSHIWLAVRSYDAADAMLAQRKETR